METSTNFQEWVEKSGEDFLEMKKHLVENDFAKVGEPSRRKCPEDAWGQQEK